MGGLLSNIMGAAVSNGQSVSSGPTKSLADIEGGGTTVKRGMPQPRAAAVVAPKKTSAAPAPAAAPGVVY